MGYRKLACLIAVSALLSGCDVLTGDDPEDDLRDQRRAWQALGISDYTYDFVRLCFCGGPAGHTMRIVVRGNQVVSVTDLQTGSAPQFMPAGWAVTIDGVFAELLAIIDSGVDKMELDFDSRFHFPVKVSIDRVKEAIDDELELTLSGFVSQRQP